MTLNLKDTAVVCLFFLFVYAPVLSADPSRIYSDQELFEKGRQYYNQEKHEQAASYLFAYIQRSPTQMLIEDRHATQVLAAMQYLMVKAESPADASADPQSSKPEQLLDAFQHSASSPERIIPTQLKKALQNKDWKKGGLITWKLMVAHGDKNGSGLVDPEENDEFPCSMLRYMSSQWKQHYGSSAGHGDLLLPRFHRRFLSCGIWQE